MIMEIIVKDTMHFLITGHTGFKGAWLSLLLLERGHTVSGISLKPDSNSLFARAGIGNRMQDDVVSDILNLVAIQDHFAKINPDVVIHLAAQSLVKESYKNPIKTFETNVLGTLNVLKASQELSNLKGQIIITTDKVYRNDQQSLGYVETDPLGGDDPYSASKAMADIATQSWCSSFEGAPTVIARAGNVIGGGDICADRLIPDLIKSFSSDVTPTLRAPNSIRPWQHVLDCINGYLILIEKVLDGTARGSWNFGPESKQSKSVADVADIAASIWGVETNWQTDVGVHPYETPYLTLNSNKARSILGWSDKLDFEQSIQWTVNWYRKVHEGSDPLKETLKNIRDFESL
jgi:CDP-glucose 4,6-dehydratase